MNLSDAGASVAIALASYAVGEGMSPFEGLDAAERVLRAARRNPRGGERLLGDVAVLEVMVAMGTEIDNWFEADHGDPDGVGS